MSQTSFTTFCLEFYSDHIRQPGPDVYRMFEKTGLLAMLRDDYDDLHGMSIEYLMQFFDKYLEGQA